MKFQQKLPFIDKNLQDELISISNNWKFNLSGHEDSESLSFICRMLPSLNSNTLSCVYPELHSLLVRTIQMWSNPPKTHRDASARIRTTYYAARSLRYLPKSAALALDSSFVRPSLDYHRNLISNSSLGILHSCLLTLSQRFSDALNLEHPLGLSSNIGGPAHITNLEELSEDSIIFMEELLSSIAQSWSERTNVSGKHFTLDMPAYSKEFLGNSYGLHKPNLRLIEWGSVDRLMVELCSMDCGLSEITFPVIERLAYQMRGMPSVCVDGNNAWVPLAAFSVLKTFLPKNDASRMWSTDAEDIILNDLAQFGLFFQQSNSENKYNQEFIKSVTNFVMDDFIKNNQSLDFMQSNHKLFFNSKKMIENEIDKSFIQWRQFVVPQLRRVSNIIPIRRIIEGIVDEKQTQRNLIDEALRTFTTSTLKAIAASNGKKTSEIWSDLSEGSKFISENNTLFRVKVRDAYLRKEAGRSLKNEESEDWFDLMEQANILSSEKKRQNELTHWGGSINSISDVVSMEERRRFAMKNAADSMYLYCGEVLVMPSKSRLYNEVLDIHLKDIFLLDTDSITSDLKKKRNCRLISGFQNDLERQLHDKGVEIVTNDMNNKSVGVTSIENQRSSESEMNNWAPRSFEGLTKAGKVGQKLEGEDKEEIELFGQRDFSFWKAKAW